MLSESEFTAVKSALDSGDSERLTSVVIAIRHRMNPHPSGQLTSNIPILPNSRPLAGVQHKYERTVLFFPRQGQTCHAYCNFCFRWPQFVGDPTLRMESSEVEPLIRYLKDHSEVQDLLLTGGDPFVMQGAVLRRYIEAILHADLPNLRTIRIGTKALTYWPYRFLSDPDASTILQTLRSIVASGRHLSIMAHFNHPKELTPAASQGAIQNLRAVGAEIRTQTPMIRGINDSAETLATLWSEQVRLGCIPYYLFAARDTGAHQFFGVPLAESVETYNAALRQVSGLAGTVRGPVMSTYMGKILVSGITQIKGDKVFVLRILQSRDPQFSGRIYFAKFDPKALWISDLVPAFAEDPFDFPLLDTGGSETVEEVA
jgi:KamA family protein